MIERELKEALKARLQTILKAEGYLTDLGLNVRVGWLAKAQSLRGDMVAVEPNTTDAQPHTQTLHDCELGLVLNMATDEPDDPDRRLDEFLSDVRRALFTGPEIDGRIIDIRQDGRGEYHLDDDGVIASLELPIRLQYQHDFLT